MSDTAPPLPVAAFRGPVRCRRTANALTLSGAAADSAQDALIATFIGPGATDLPLCLTGAAILPLAERRYRITGESREWIIEAISLSVHRDVTAAFQRAIPPRVPPLAKRLFWRVVLALAGTRAGKRILLTLRR